MSVNPIAALGSLLPTSTPQSEALRGLTGAGQGAGVQALASERATGAPAEGQGLGSLGASAIGEGPSTGSVGETAGAAPAGEGPGAESGAEGTFSGALGQALEALEQTQATAGNAAQQVATGTTSNPEGAVVKVQNAELEMQLASQIRAKATEAVQSVFQTQV